MTKLNVKKIKILPVLMLAWTTAGFAQNSVSENNAHGDLHADLDTIHLDMSLDIIRSVNTASIDMDLNQGLIMLTLVPQGVCSPGVLCAEVMPEPVTVTLPIQSTSEDACGVRFYKAAESIRSSSGSFRTLVVQDSSQNTCRNHRIATEVLLETENNNLGGVELIRRTRSVFSSNKPLAERPGFQIPKSL